MSATLLKPRDYQTECIRAIHSKWEAGIWRPASVLPTGAGKTVVFSHLAEQYLAMNAGRRVLILSHTEELGDQAASKMRQVAPHRSVGIVRAQRNEVHAQVISASVMTLRNAKRLAQIKNVGLIIVDECHHAVAKSYRKILEHFGALPPADAPATWTPSALAAGFTATLVRGDKEKLSEVWQEVAYRKDIAFMIRRGYLLDVRGQRVVVPDFDLRSVRQSGGDYQDGALGEELVRSMAPEIVAKKYAEVAGDRKGIGFAPTVESAYVFAEAFEEQGIKSEVIHGNLLKPERKAILERLHTGATQVVWSCMALIEGFDEPTVSAAVIARPTKSAGLYQQMVGRVLRPDLTLPVAERGYALVLDVVGISREHTLRSLIDLSSREDLRDLDPDDMEDLEDLSLLDLEGLEDLTLPEDPEDEPGSGLGDPGYYMGPVDTEDFDPLARDSSNTWGRSPSGVYWMTAGGHSYVFLNESLTGDPGTYDVVWCSAIDPATKYWRDLEKLKEAHGEGPYAGMTEHVGLSFEMALSWAEDEAIERGGYGAKTLAAKSARWRKDEPGQSQQNKARSLGIDIPRDPEGRCLWTKGELSDAIGNVLAGRRIDGLLRKVNGGRG